MAVLDFDGLLMVWHRFLLALVRSDVDMCFFGERGLQVLFEIIHG